MTDLSSWLLEQIAADQAETFALEPYHCEPGCCAPADWVGHRCLICNDGTSYGGTVEAITEIAREHEESVHQRSSTLVRCKAYRAIVELHTYDDDFEGCEHCRKDAWPCPTLRALASMYADRPGYDPAWRLA